MQYREAMVAAGSFSSARGNVVVDRLSNLRQFDMVWAERLIFSEI